MANLALLKKEIHRQEELEKTATKLSMELDALRDQMEMAKADAMAAFLTSQPFFDECSIYYSNSFDDYLKQVAAIYPNLDLSQIAIDDTIPPMPSGPNAVR